MLYRKNFPAPDDGVAGEACDPERCCDEVAERQQPQVREHLVVRENLSADGHRERKTQEETQGENPETERAESARDNVEESKSESVGEKQARVAAWSCVAYSAQPAELMVTEAAPRVRRYAGFDHLAGERDAESRFVNAFAKFIVVGKMIDEGLKSADLLECFSADRERGAKTVTKAALDHAGNQDAGHEVRGDAERFET